MAIRDLVPKFRGEQVPARRAGEDSLQSFHREMNRLFDDFFGDFGLLPSWPAGEGEGPARFAPRVNVSETESEVKVSAELPGMDEKDVTVELDENAVVIRGEKKEEREEKDASWHRREYSYGSFQRMIPLPASVDGSKARASFKKGVLTVELPKRPEEKEKRKTIAIKAE